MLMLHDIASFCITILLALLGITSNELPTPQEEKNTEQVIVQKVLDGDTFIARSENRSITIRLLGIDAPESSGPYRKEECFGKESSQWLQTLLPPGTVITLRADPTNVNKDAYDRYLRYATLGNETVTLNERSIRAGMAEYYSWRKHPFQLQDTFRTAQQEALSNKRGLWNPRNCPTMNRT